MAKSDRPRGPHERDEGEPVRSDPFGRDYPVFARLRGVRWQGSGPATAQAFARALAQWRRLPGAIGATAADLGNAAATPPPAAGGGGTNDVP
jgi:hypothetical protein